MRVQVEPGRFRVPVLPWGTVALLVAAIFFLGIWPSLLHEAADTAATYCSPNPLSPSLALLYSAGTAAQRPNPGGMLVAAVAWAGAFMSG